jgi:hypothetical protein
MWFLYRDGIHIHDVHHRCDVEVMSDSGKMCGFEPEIPQSAQTLDKLFHFQMLYFSDVQNKENVYP